MKYCIAIVFVVLFAVSSDAAKPISLGPLCLNTVQCFVNPCQFSRCPAHVNAVCRPNYCGGCFANWFLDNKLVDCSASETAVETRQEKCVPVYCFVNPCAFAKCKNHPNAVCKADYCGGCNARFYVSEERVQCD